MADPHYIRPDAAGMSETERDRFLNAIVELKQRTRTGSSVSIYDEFVALHWGVTRLRSGPAANIDGGHGDAGFLPWHREYLFRFEQELKKIDSRVAVPYWNWSGWETDDWSAQNVYGALFQPAFMGGPGTDNPIIFSGEVGQLAQGYFAGNATQLNPNGWQVRNEIVSQFPFPNGYGTTLRRRTSLDPDAWNGWRARVAAIMGDANASTFDWFRPELEGHPHGTGHLWVGGNMRTMTSPDDPIFWLHHAEIDRLWLHWQKTHVANGDWEGTYQTATTRHGHRIDDPMWPWDGGASAPDQNNAITPLVPSFPASDVRRVRDALDPYEYGYCYESDQECVSAVVARATSKCCQSCKC